MYLDDLYPHISPTRNQKTTLQTERTFFLFIYPVIFYFIQISRILYTKKHSTISKKRTDQNFLFCFIYFETE